MTYSKSMVNTVTPTGAARRGRPARYSREQIVDAVAEMLLADPEAPLTIARAAETVGAAPMSLYRHFADRADLVNAVAQRVFAADRPTLAPGTPWQEAVRGWMNHIFRQASRAPQLVQLVASGESPAWLPDSAYLAAVIEEAGVQDEAAVAEAVYWIATTTLGHAMIRLAASPQAPIEPTADALARLSDDDAARVRGLIPRFTALHRDGFDRVVDWTIASLERHLALDG